KIIAGPVPSEKVTRRRFDGQVHQAELLVHSDLRPYSGVARVVSRAIQPRVVAELALLRDGMEDPQPLSRPHLETADITLIVAKTLGRHPFPKRRANDDGVSRDNRRGLEPDFAGSNIG